MDDHDHEDNDDDDYPRHLLPLRHDMAEKRPRQRQKQEQAGGPDQDLDRCG